MLCKGSIKKSLVQARNKKTEFENILFFNLFGMRSLETTMTNLGDKKSEFKATIAKRRVR